MLSEALEFCGVPLRLTKTPACVPGRCPISKVVVDPSPMCVLSTMNGTPDSGVV